MLYISAIIPLTTLSHSLTLTPNGRTLNVSPKSDVEWECIKDIQFLNNVEGLAFVKVFVVFVVNHKAVCRLSLRSWPVVRGHLVLW